jgi:hypothetical protein
MSPLARAAGSWLAGAVVAVAVVVAVGLLPTLRLGGESALAALVAGCSVSLLGAFLGAAPVLMAVAAGGTQRPHVTAGWAMALRSGGTLAGALAGALGSSLPRVVFLAWVAIAYGALLVVETRWTVRWLDASGPAARS